MKCARVVLAAIAICATPKVLCAQQPPTVEGVRAAGHDLFAADRNFTHPVEVAGVGEVQAHVRCDTTIVQPRVDSASPYLALMKPYKQIRCGFLNQADAIFTIEAARIAADTGAVTIRYFYFTEMHGMVDQRRTYILARANGRWVEVRRNETTLSPHG
ncbi:MAG TPA: hypothetical protein VGM84_19690 [Steroidobacteraceae bacterium]